MKCPVDQTDLSMTDRQGIEIDFCPQCRGVWLDRGELDKIIERSSASSTQQPPQNYHKHVSNTDSHYTQKQYDNYSDSNKHSKKRKKEGFLGDLFDF